MSCLFISVGFNQLRDIVDKNSMMLRKIRVRYISSDGVASARRDWEKSVRSKQGSIVGKL
jgi:hypothetical protein